MCIVELAMSKRINITLPDKTLTILDKVAPKGRRSDFISRAVLHFVESHGKESLRTRLKQEALVNAARDVEMAAEWFGLEEETGRRALDPERKRSNRRKTKVA